MRWVTCAILLSINGSFTAIFNGSSKFEREDYVTNLYGFLARMDKSNVCDADSLVKEPQRACKSRSKCLFDFKI
jgi:hypothetical protein